MNNLVIGASSQLGHYFPESYTKISSRDVNIGKICETQWDTVYICYAEQRTSLAYSGDNEVQQLFHNTNYVSVRNLIQGIQKRCKHIIYFSTAELWNCRNGPVRLGTPFSYASNHYTNSKYDITHELSDKLKYPNVSVAFPFNFNSVHRKDTYLFSKIFHSILHKEKITIGDIHCYRELLHPSMVVDAATSHEAVGVDFTIGSGRLTYINDFVEELYLSTNLKMSDYVTIDPSATASHYKNHIFYNSEKIDRFSTIRVLNKTVLELRGMI